MVSLPMVLASAYPMAAPLSPEAEQPRDRDEAKDDGRAMHCHQAYSGPYRDGFDDGDGTFATVDKP
jgi:hypothetical protein